MWRSCLVMSFKLTMTLVSLYFTMTHHSSDILSATSAKRIIFLILS